MFDNKQHSTVIRSKENSSDEDNTITYYLVLGESPKSVLNLQPALVSKLYKMYLFFQKLLTMLN